MREVVTWLLIGGLMWSIWSLQKRVQDLEMCVEHFICPKSPVLQHSRPGE